jgi:formiminoglutamate deiminase
VTPETLRAVLDRAGSVPIHIHIAEQTKEVEDCVAWSGQRPIEWLVDHVPVDERWCLVHATHLTAAETRRVALSGAVVGLCPITEASLGDGVFNGPEYLNMGGRFGVGSDSNIDIDAAGELRQLEYSQRIARRSRNVLTTREGESTGERLFLEALKGGAQAVGRPIGKLEVGYRADIVVLDSEHPDLANNRSDDRLDTWIFSAGHSAVRMTLASGEKVVTDGRHVRRDGIVARYHATMRKLREV